MSNKLTAAQELELKAQRLKDEAKVVEESFEVLKSRVSEELLKLEVGKSDDKFEELVREMRKRKRTVESLRDESEGLVRLAKEFRKDSKEGY